MDYLYAPRHDTVSTVKSISSVVIFLSVNPELDNSGTKALPANSENPEIAFRQVSFGYDARSVLRNVSFVVPKDSMTALVGPSGFWGCLTFPIRDVAGHVIAFGGRLVDGEGAKYINSPEGAIYSKIGRAHV